MTDYIWTYNGKTIADLTPEECREALVWYTSANFHMEQSKRNADLQRLIDSVVKRNETLAGALEALQIKYEELLVRHAQHLPLVRMP